MDADKKRIPVRFPFRRAEQGALDVQIPFAPMVVEGVAAVGPVVLGGAGGAGGGDGQEDERQDDPAPAPDEKQPSEPQEDGGSPQTEGGGRRQGGGDGDTGDEGRCKGQERAGAGRQLLIMPAAMPLWASRASSTRWQRTLMPRGMLRSSGLKLGLWRGAATGWAGFLTPRKK
jgi:hypothetical protein